VEGMPLVRFKTGDLCYHFREACACGRQTLRMGPILGRKKQMIKFKGTTLFPPAFYEILNETEEVDNYVVEVSTNSIDTDDIRILVGSRQAGPELEKRIKDHCRARLRVAPHIEFRDPEEVHRLQFPGENRKAITFVDKRKA
jgi:phenylacetate-CoA ligase